MTVNMKAESLLPLNPQVTQILLTLLDGEKHGYGIVQAINESCGGSVQELKGGLYRYLRRMLEAGLITELSELGVSRPADSRRRYYGITSFGRSIPVAEVTRLTQLVEFARSKNLVDGEVNSTRVEVRERR